MSARILILLALLTGCGGEQAPPPKTVEVKVVGPERFLLTMHLYGTIEPKQASLLIARTTGAVDFIAEQGAFLKRGDVIAEIEVTEAKRTYDLAKTAYDLAKTTYERGLSLSKNRTASAQEVDDRQSKMIAMEKEYLVAKNALDLNTFRAPFDGVVGVFQVREGAHMSPGDALCSFYKPDMAVISFSLPESAIPYLGKESKIIVNGKTYPLTHAQNMLDPKTHMAPASFDYECGEKCIFGKTVDIHLVLKDIKDAFTVPLDSIYYQGTDAFVYVIRDKKAMPTKVELAERSEGTFLVKSGLNPGDQVIIKNISRLWPTVDVVVLEKKKEAERDAPKPEKKAE